MSTYLAIWILIICIFFTARLWLWLYKHAFWVKIDRKILFISLFVWGIAAASILLFPKIMGLLNIQTFTNWKYTRDVAFIFMWYLNSLIIVLNLFMRWFSKIWFFNLIIFNIYFLFCFLILKQLNLDLYVLNVVFYYLFVAYGEEFIKNQLALWIDTKAWKVDSDILLYHILIAIWFAFWENIVYVVGAISFSTFLWTIFGGIWIVLMRWLIGFGAHTFYSSLIWMWNILWIFSILLFGFLAMIIHYGYDLWLYFDYKIIIPIFIIVIYFWLTFIFYKIDRLYVN